MIDIHSHILASVDDGATSIKESIELLKKAENAGFSDVILTPHYIENYYENTKSIISNKIKELKQQIYDENIVVSVHQGNEIFLTENISLLLQEGKVSTLANSRYILFELPFTTKMLNVEELIYQIQNMGYVPIIAHPERYNFIQENPQNLSNLLALGVLSQCNYGSFIGLYGREAKNTAEILLENKLIHFLGTDTHKQGYIYENIEKILKRIEEISKSKKYITEITTTNPKCILEDLEL